MQYALWRPAGAGRQSFGASRRDLLKINPSTRRKANREQAAVIRGASKPDGRTLHRFRCNVRVRKPGRDYPRKMIKLFSHALGDEGRVHLGLLRLVSTPSRWRLHRGPARPFHLLQRRWRVMPTDYAKSPLKTGECPVIAIDHQTCDTQRFGHAPLISIFECLYPGGPFRERPGSGRRARDV